MTSGAAWIVRLAATVATAPAVSTACTPNEKAPGVVGVPDTIPAAFSERPCGGVPEISDHVYGGSPPVALNACDYGTLTVPFGPLTKPFTCEIG